METEDPYGIESQRRRAWTRRLGRLRLGAEPLEVQLDRLRRANWALTIVSTTVASMLFTLFAVFRAAIVGVVVAGGLFLPVVALAWLDFARLARAVRDHDADGRKHGTG